MGRIGLVFALLVPPHWGGEPKHRGDCEPSTGDHFIDQGANPPGQTLLDQHQRMVDYIGNFITALNAAKNKITVAEQEARDTAAESGGA
ncbi:hypothetical protein [Amycolatopsis sp. PS_44_ISF1]|uniref:hypothetical protein n=1 Tax=Amycolatopsis sp. PS_44_ISF1 TaxID=2974917 RepID=UPI0028DED057|nr:hypothetical protein [Amycolatopsis sp. PS_44_ISF1]MDT8915490.1 hypothetical protein [Amycolatopsis sp. PS_44_ISF1]